jgi:sec-independent protein translocase protein TatA
VPLSRSPFVAEEIAMGIGLDQPSHWAVIAVIALLLFGYKKLPEMARSAGKSMRIFKTELKGMAADDDARAEHKAEPVSGPAETATPPAPSLSPPAVAAAEVPAPAPVVEPVKSDSDAETVNPRTN